MSLETLKNNFAQEQGYEDFESFVIGSYSPDNVSKAAAIGDFQAAMEVICIRAQKAALEKAAESLDFKMINTINEKKEDKIACRYDYTSVIVDRTSITNPENLIR